MSDVRSMVFRINGQCPSGKNNIRVSCVGGKPRKYPSKRFAEWRDSALAQLPDMDVPWQGPLFIEVQHFPKDRVRRDAPGLLDAIFHVLEAGKIIEDDSQFKNTWIKDYPPSKENPRLVILIGELHNDEASYYQ